MQGRRQPKGGRYHQSAVGPEQGQVARRLGLVPERRRLDALRRRIVRWPRRGRLEREQLRSDRQMQRPPHRNSLSFDHVHRWNDSI